MRNDLRYMTRAYHLALKGRGRTSPNPAVGAVVVKGGRVIAEGWHARCGAAHAEAVAIKRAGARARGSTLYVTLEPCFHQGRTPPCVDLILKSGVRTVVVGMKDPNPLTCGKSLVRMRRAGIRVRCGFMQKELFGLNESFCKYMTRGLPLVTAKTAQTIDGKIATAAGASKWITSKKTRAFARRLRNNFDAIMVGINTVLADDPDLGPPRRSKRWVKVVLDSGLRISLRARLLRKAGPATACLIATTRKAAGSKITRLQKAGAEVLVCPSQKGQVDLRFVMRHLARRQVTSVLLEGGARLIGQALKERLVDRVQIYIAPLAFADQGAKSALDGLGIKRIEQAVRITDGRMQPIGRDWMFAGSVMYPK